MFGFAYIVRLSRHVAWWGKNITTVPVGRLVANDRLVPQAPDDLTMHKDESKPSLVLRTTIISDWDLSRSRKCNGAKCVKIIALKFQLLSCLLVPNGYGAS